MAEPSIQPYEESQRDAVLGVLTEAYKTNPMHLAVFGGDGPAEARQNRAFLSALLEMIDGTRLVAIHGGSVVGYVGWVSSPGCRPPNEKVAAVMPRLLPQLADGVAPRMITMFRAWRRQDPDAAHSHFGPIGVSPDLQGTGIGRLLIRRYCAEVDRSAEEGYLETDRPENVGFYGRSGFEVIAEAEILGVRNWFMRRPARAGL